MGAAKTDDERRIEELLRVNAELAAEIRSLASGRTDEPRSKLAPAARRLGRLVDERDSLAAELEAAKLEQQRLEQHVEGLERGLGEQAAELARLRAGILGLLRRGIARLLRR